MTVTREKLNDHKVEMTIKLIKMSLWAKKINIVNIFDEAVASSSKVRRNQDMSYRKSVTKIKKSKPNQNLNLCLSFSNWQSWEMRY